MRSLPCQSFACFPFPLSPRYTRHRQGRNHKRIARFGHPISSLLAFAPILLVLLALVICSGAAEAAVTKLSGGNTAAWTSGDVETMTSYGLQLGVDTRWLDGSGYRPIRITVKPQVPVPADRKLRLEVLVGPSWSGEQGFRVQQDIEIPAGTTPATPVQATLSVPQYAGFSMLTLNVFEDGKLREKLCTSLPVTDAQNGIIEGMPKVLFVDNAMPDTKQLATALGDEFIRQRFHLAGVGASNPGPLTLPTASVFSAADLPERWIDYTNLDVVCLSLPQLTELKATRPAAFRAMAEWTAAGGNLWIYDLGNDWQRMEELEGLLGLGPAAPRAGDGKTSGWQQPEVKLFGKPFRKADANSGINSDDDEAGGRATQRSRADAKPPEQPPFVLRPLGQGMVVALAADDPFPGKKEEWNWLLQSVGQDRLFWEQRHGLSFARGNAEFWNLLIPGIGLAPVTEFCVLITLFVLVIGPLNYWLLRRRKKLHLLVLTVPLGAGAVTLALFVYAIVADGFSTRVRVRSVTQIDQRQRQAVCWARLSYYAGVAPSRGLEFPADVAVFPFQEAPMTDYNQIQAREMFWDDQQRLTGGWLFSRTPTQYLTVRTRPTTLGLDLIEPADSAGKWQVKNRLGTRIEQLVVQSRDKHYYTAADIEPGATATLEPIERATAQMHLARVAAEQQPAYPPGVSRQRNGGFFDFSRRSYSYGRRWGYGDLPEPTQQTGRLEQSLAAFDASGTNAMAAWSPGSYVAIVQQSPEVVLGIPAAREEASFHVIFGRW
jgi:hypothetical protein